MEDNLKRYTFVSTILKSNQMTVTKDTIVAFHIGRGGKFNNSGYLFFCGEKSIGDFVSDLYLSYENQNDFKDRYGYSQTCDDQECIIDLITGEEFYELEEKFGITEKMLGDVIYCDKNGSSVGLTLEACESGIGRINIDGDYDTTYTKYLGECDDAEIEAIKRSDVWNKAYFLEFFEQEGLI